MRPTGDFVKTPRKQVNRRRIVGWSMSAEMTARLVADAALEGPPVRRSGAVRLPPWRHDASGRKSDGKGGLLARRARSTMTILDRIDPKS